MAKRFACLFGPTWLETGLNIPAMGRKKFCYWSVADGQHGLMMQTCVRSAGVARVREDFHVWSDRAIAGDGEEDLLFLWWN